MHYGKFRCETTIKQATQGHVSQRSDPSRTVGLNNIKLPTINLPKFCKAYDSWLKMCPQTLFKDTFLYLIHENSAINNIQKYHYLRAFLEGKAA